MPQLLKREHFDGVLACFPEAATRPQGSPWFTGVNAAKGQARGTLAFWHVFPAKALQEKMRTHSKAGKTAKNNPELTFCGLVLKPPASATWEMMNP